MGTCPWEDNMSKWHFRKNAKYSQLKINCEAKGWKVHPLCVEVGCRGYVAESFHRMCNRHLSWMWRRQQNTVATTSSETAIKSIGSQSLPSTCRSGVPLSTYRGVHNSHQSLWQYGKQNKRSEAGLLNTMGESAFAS